MVSDILGDAERRMQGAIVALRDDLNLFRTGRASPQLIERIQIEYYGTSMPLNQLATITAPESRLLLVQPWDREALISIEKALRKSDHGLNPVNDGSLVLRIPIPPLTEERRSELVRMAHQRVEQGRVAVRNVRRDNIERIRGKERQKAISQDESRRAQDSLQKLTDRFTGEIDQLGRQKDTEVMEV